MEKDLSYKIQTDENISADNENIRIVFYANIGFFIEVAQMLEYNLRKLICYHKSVTEIEAGELTRECVDKICKKYDDYYVQTYKKKFTLGKLKDELKCITLIDEKIFAIFDEINDYRIQIVHKIFQNNVHLDKFRDSKFVSDYTQKRLIPMTDKTKVINDMVINLINTYKEDLHAYKDRVGIEYEK